MAELLYGKPAADALTAETRRRADMLREKNVLPRLVILRCGENEADGAYIRGAMKRGGLCGVDVELRTLAENVSADELARALEAVNSDNGIHGCLLLRPLPEHLKAMESKLCALLDPKKDVDGMTPVSAAGVFTGGGQGFPPCTAQACMALLDYYHIDSREDRDGGGALRRGGTARGHAAAGAERHRDRVPHGNEGCGRRDTGGGHYHHRCRCGGQPDGGPCPAWAGGGGRVYQLERRVAVRRRGVRRCISNRGGHYARARRRGRGNVSGADGAYGPGGGIPDRGGRPMNLFTPAETAANYAAAGEVKTQYAAVKLLLLGMAAGALIGFPVCVTGMATYTLASASVVRIVSGILFAFGLGIVVLTGAELFTGNTLIVISLLDKRVTLGAMLRNWGIVYTGNFLGAVVLSWICTRFGWMDAGEGALAAYVMKLAAGKMSMPFENAFFMGVLCNILVTVAVLVSLSAKDVVGRMLGAWAPVMFFVVAGFSHSIADMTYCALALFGKNQAAYTAAAQSAGVDVAALTWGRYFLGNMLPVTLGNILGGLLVGWIAWYCFLRQKG